MKERIYDGNVATHADCCHKADVWQDDYGEWVWACTCELGRLHGGYATEESAQREAANHD